MPGLLPKLHESADPGLYLLVVVLFLSCITVLIYDSLVIFH
jgi:hypothetical protein